MIFFFLLFFYIGDFLSLGFLDYSHSMLGASMASASLLSSKDSYEHSSDEKNHPSPPTNQYKQSTRIFTKHKTNKANVRRRVNPLPRILKRDIRRQYASMYINVLNSGDVNYMNKFLHQFCLFNCGLQVDNSLQENVHVFQVQVHGHQFLQTYFELSFLRYPDMVFNLSDVVFIRDMHSEAVQIRFQVLIHGTKVPTVCENELLSVPTMQFLRQHLPLVSGINKFLEEYDTFQFKGYMTLFVDEQNRIYDIRVK